MIALSLGWGVQSFVLAAMSALGELPRVDVAIHSDTTHERAATYAFAAQWTPWLEARGVRVVTVSDPIAANKILEDNGQTHAPLYTLSPDGNMGKLRRSCTQRWKIAPLEKYLDSIRNGAHVEQWLGISLDEWHRAKDSDVKWITRRHPLLDLKMTRADCLAWLEAHNLPSPGKSACVFCPFHSRLSWQQLKREDGADWRRAVEVDTAIRNVRPGYLAFVNRQCKPLTEAVVIPEDSGYSQLDMLSSDDADAECDSGHCFL